MASVFSRRSQRRWPRIVSPHARRLDSEMATSRLSGPAHTLASGSALKARVASRRPEAGSQVLNSRRAEPGAPASLPTTACLADDAGTDAGAPGEHRHKSRASSRLNQALATVLVSGKGG